MAFEAVFLVIFITVISDALGCGQLPTGQGRMIGFEVTGFKPPAAMVYTEDVPSQARVPQISTSEQGAKAFVQNLIMGAVHDVLYQQGRGAALPDNVISLILQQLTLNVTYTPLRCIKVFIDANGMNVVMMGVVNCQIISGTVTNVCDPGAAQQPCMPNQLMPVPTMHTTISGRLETSNIIMANWSSQMWQSVLNRVLRQLTSGAFASNFSTATVTLK